jgi:hypothetical protein
MRLWSLAVLVRRAPKSRRNQRPHKNNATFLPPYSRIKLVAARMKKFRHAHHKADRLLTGIRKIGRGRLREASQLVRVRKLNATILRCREYPIHTVFHVRTRSFLLYPIVHPNLPRPMRCNGSSVLGDGHLWIVSPVPNLPRFSRDRFWRMSLTGSLL